MSKNAKVVKIYLASDHKGFDLKEQIKKWLASWDYNPEDLGAFRLDPQDDYPDFIASVASRVSNNANSKGIILGSSGQGEAILANKYDGVRAVVYYGGPLKIIKLSRLHNDSNVLSLGASFLSPDQAKEAIKLWLETEFNQEARHKRRLKKIAEIEKKL